MLERFDLGLETAYVAAVLVLGAWAVWRLRTSLRRSEREVQERLAARRAVMAAPTPKSETDSGRSKGESWALLAIGPGLVGLGGAFTSKGRWGT